MSPQIKALFDELDRCEERVPLELLTRRLEQLDVTVADFREWIEFSPIGDDRYRRNLMHEGPGYQALVLCWRAGQRSPIHDHEGSTCGVKVLKGVATEAIFERIPGRGLLRVRKSHDLHEGLVCGSQDADIHQISNMQDDGGELITLHIYSPALLTMNTYSLTDSSVSRFVDPVHEFVQGAGI